jgi:hypothetical protein
MNNGGDDCDEAPLSKLFGVILRKDSVRVV